MRMPPITVTLHSVRSVVKQNLAGATQDGLHTPSVLEPVRTVGIPAHTVFRMEHVPNAAILVHTITQKRYIPMRMSLPVIISTAM